MLGEKKEGDRPGGKVGAREHGGRGKHRRKEENQVESKKRRD